MAASLVLAWLLLAYCASGTLPDRMLTDVYSDRVNSPGDKKIPRNVWIAVRDKSAPLREHTRGLMARNPSWKFIISDNEEKDLFLSQAFANASLQWAYDKINPNVGAARADLWRYAVLWKYGGFYLDCDSDMLSPLDEIVSPKDEFLFGSEKNMFSGDRCYNPLYHLSDMYVNRKYSQPTPLFSGKILLNWAVAAAPGHPFLERTMENAVEAIRGEYEGEPVLRHHRHAPQWHLVICCTGPSLFTASIREVILEDASRNSVSYRFMGVDFHKYNGVYKVGNENEPQHYSEVLKREALLREYQPNSPVNAERLQRWQGKCIQTLSRNVFFYVDNGKRRVIDFDTFDMFNFTVADVIVISDYKMGTIPIGDPMPAIPKPKK